MARNAKVSYDEENDILWVGVGEKVKDSLQVDKFVIDFSYDDKIVGIEIFDALEVISNMGSVKISKEDLAGINEATIGFYPSKELLYTVVTLVLQIDDRIREIPIQVPAPKVAMAVK